MWAGASSTRVECAWFQSVILKYVGPLSNVAFKLNLFHYAKGGHDKRRGGNKRKCKRAVVVMMGTKYDVMMTEPTCVELLTNRRFCCNLFL